MSLAVCVGEDELKEQIERGVSESKHLILHYKHHVHYTEAYRGVLERKMPVIGQDILTSIYQK